jgi:DNA polymerase-3 subunit gamma/tau
MIRQHTDEELTAAIVAALDSVYALPDAPQDIPVSEIERERRRRRPLLTRYRVVGAAAAAAALILAYPAVTAIGTGQARHAAALPARRSAPNPRLVTSLASLHPVSIGAGRTPSIRSVVLDHHRVTAWVAHVSSSGRYVYALDSAQLTEFTATLPPSDSGLTDPCSWTVRLGAGTPQTYQTQPAASVPMTLEGAGASTMTITVAPTQPAAGAAANCAMTNPVVVSGPSGASASAAPEPAASQGLGSPPAGPSPQVGPSPQLGPSPQVGPSQQPQSAPAQQPPPAPSSSASAASPPPTPSGAATPTQASTPTAAATPTAAPTGTPTGSATEPVMQPEGGDGG